MQWAMLELHGLPVQRASKLQVCLPERLQRDVSIGGGVLELTLFDYICFLGLP